MRLIKFNEDSRESVFKGIEELALAVKTTLGPKGRNVIYERRVGQPSITKDGVTVAINVFFDDPFKDTGASIIKEAALKTNDEVGDGTSTALVLAEAIIRAGMSLLKDNKKVSPVALKEGIDKATKEVIEKLKEYSIAVDNNLDIIENVATISGNNDPRVGQMIRSALESVGDGVIEVEPSQTTKTSIRTTEGMEIDTGYIHYGMMNNEKKRTAEFENPIIFVSNFVFKRDYEIQPFIEASIKTGRPLVMFVDDIIEGAQQFFVQHYRNKFQGVVIKTPSFGQMQIENVHDIAAYVGAYPIERKLVLKPHEQIIDFIAASGECEKIIVGQRMTHILKGQGGESLNERLAQIDNDLKSTPSNYDKEVLLKRKGRLLGKACVIEVGGESIFEMEELKDRVEDALNATRSAIKEGIVPGGGISLYNISKEMLSKLNITDDLSKGVELLYKAIQVPFNQIIYNAGINVNDALTEISNLSKYAEDKRLIGFDAKSNEACDMYNRGIIDPTLVPIHALKNAASIAGTFLTTECVIVHKPLDEPPMA